MGSFWSLWLRLTVTRSSGSLAERVKQTIGEPDRSTSS